MTRKRAEAFWQRIAQDVVAGKRALLIAENARGICGTVQLLFELPENQPHRADLAKRLVHRRARRQGLGAALRQDAESAARDCGRTRVGDIPDYAIFPQGGRCSSTVYFRKLEDMKGGA